MKMATLIAAAIAMLAAVANAQAKSVTVPMNGGTSVKSGSGKMPGFSTAGDANLWCSSYWSCGITQYLLFMSGNSTFPGQRDIPDDGIAFDQLYCCAAGSSSAVAIVYYE